MLTYLQKNWWQRWNPLYSMWRIKSMKELFDSSPPETGVTLQFWLILLFKLVTGSSVISYSSSDGIDSGRNRYWLVPTWRDFTMTGDIDRCLHAGIPQWHAIALRWGGEGRDWGQLTWLWCQIDGLLQDCSISSAMHWRYCSLALSHQDVLM